MSRYSRWLGDRPCTGPSVAPHQGLGAEPGAPGVADGEAQCHLPPLPLGGDGAPEAEPGGVPGRPPRTADGERSRSRPPTLRRPGSARRARGVRRHPREPTDRGAGDGRTRSGPGRSDRSGSSPPVARWPSIQNEPVGKPGRQRSGGTAVIRPGSWPSPPRPVAMNRVVSFIDRYSQAPSVRTYSSSSYPHIQKDRPLPSRHGQSRSHRAVARSPSRSILGLTKRWREKVRVGVRSRSAMAGRPTALPSPGPPSHSPSTVNSSDTSSASWANRVLSTTPPPEYRRSTSSP